MQELSLPIINSGYNLYKNIADITNHCDKRWRFSLGVSVENTILSCLENLIFAKNAPKPLKAGYLLKANTDLEICVLKLRLFLEFDLANETRIFQCQAICREIGRMLGGWIKSLQNS